MTHKGIANAHFARQRGMSKHLIELMQGGMNDEYIVPRAMVSMKTDDFCNFLRDTKDAAMTRLALEFIHDAHLPLGWSDDRHMFWIRLKYGKRNIDFMVDVLYESNDVKEIRRALDAVHGIVTGTQYAKLLEKAPNVGARPALAAVGQ